MTDKKKCGACKHRGGFAGFCPFELASVKKTDDACIHFAEGKTT